MPRPLKPTNPYASWTALFSATLQRLRQELPEQPAVTQAEFGRRVYASGSKVSAIERGQVRPDAAFVEACERELPAGGILRAMLPLVIREWEYWARLGTTPPTGGPLPPDGIAPPGEVAATPAELADVAFLEAAADGAVEAVELAREAEASDLGAGTLENIDLAVDRLRRSYASAPPALLIPRVQARLRGLRRLHTGRLNLAQRRQLLVAGGWLATLLATLQFDAGDQPAAEDSRDAALQLGKAAGHQEIMAWSFELLAWFALVNHQPRQALDLAQQGLTLAPNTSAGVQLAMQQARVWARLGQRRETEQEGADRCGRGSGQGDPRTRRGVARQDPAGQRGLELREQHLRRAGRRTGAGQRQHHDHQHGRPPDRLMSTEFQNEIKGGTIQGLVQGSNNTLTINNYNGKPVQRTVPFLAPPLRRSGLIGRDAVLQEFKQLLTRGRARPCHSSRVSPRRR